MFTVGSKVSIEGDIESDEPVVVVGKFSGTLKSPAITIAPKAVVTGTLISERIEISGHVTADVFAGTLVLSDTSTVHGRIFHRALNLQEGAYFEGQSRRHPNPLSLAAA